MAKVKDMEAAMTEYFQSHAGDAGVGLEILPGVQEILTELSVRCFAPARPAMSGVLRGYCMSHADLGNCG